MSWVAEVLWLLTLQLWLLAIRRGDITWEEVERWRLSLHKELDAALAATLLPEHPDYSRANDFLVRARRLAASPGYGA